MDMLCTLYNLLDDCGFQSFLLFLLLLFLCFSFFGSIIFLFSRAPQECVQRNVPTQHPSLQVDFS